LHHPRPDISALAGSLEIELARRLGVRERPIALGRITQWRAVGAFDNDEGKGFQTEYAPETNLDFDGEYAGMRLPIRWRDISQWNMDGNYPLGELLAPADFAVGYLATTLMSPDERTVQLRLSTSTATKVWLNQNLVLSEERLSRYQFDNLIVSLHLHKGANLVLVKSAHKQGEWWFGARLTKEDGQLDTDVETADPARSPLARERRGAGERYEAPLPPTSKARQHFVAAERLRRAGLLQRAKSEWDTLDGATNPLSTSSANRSTSSNVASKPIQKPVAS
jgi:hypothetical protein